MPRGFRLGKRRIHEQMDFCEFCNSYEKLRSYDALEFLKLLFLPIVPLGNKRIIRECTRCKNSRQVVDLKLWEEHKRWAIEKAFQDWRLDPMDSHAAKKLMDSYIMYQDEEGFLRFAEEAKYDFPYDAEILAGLGEGYEQFNYIPAAEEGYTRSWMMKDDVKIRERLGHALLKQLRPDEARPFLQHILDGRLRNRMFFLYLVVEAYQAVGRHKAALGYLKECHRFFPEIEKSKTFKRLQGISEKLYDKTVRIPSENLPMSLSKTAIRRLEQRTFRPYNVKPQGSGFSAQNVIAEKAKANPKHVSKSVVESPKVQPAAATPPAAPVKRETPRPVAATPPRPAVEPQRVQPAAATPPVAPVKRETPRPVAATPPRPAAGPQRAQPVAATPPTAPMKREAPRPVAATPPRPVVEPQKVQPVAATPPAAPVKREVCVAEPRTKSMKFEFPLVESTRKLLPAKKAVACLFAVLIGLYAAIAFYKGNFQTVYIVNGLNRSYLAEINGVTQKLPAMGQVTVKLAEGKVTVRVAEKELGIPEQNCTIQTPFLIRPINKRVFIINPDRVAILFWDNSRFEEGYLNANHKPVSRYYAGQFLYQLDGADFVFQSPAKDGPIPKNRTRLVQVTKPLTQRMANQVYRSLKQDDARFFARHRLFFDPDDETALEQYAELVPAEEAIEFLQSFLEERPVKVELHKLYQDIREKFQPDYNLAREYAEYVTGEPDNNDLQYLLGRVTADFGYAETLYRRSVTGQNPCPYGLHALALNRLAEGHFNEALELADQALRILPERNQFLYVKKEALLGLGKVDELLTLVKKDQVKDPNDAELVAEEIRVFMKKGQEGVARATVQKFLGRIHESNSGESKEWNHYFEAVVAHCAGDEEGFLKNIEVLGDVNWQFQAAIVKGNLGEAGVLNEIMGSHPYNNLLVYIGAKVNNKPQIAEKQIQAAINGLSKGTKEERFIAKCLQSNGNIDLNSLAGLAMDPADKRIVLTAIGIQFPWHQVYCFELASKLNYKATFPQRYLAKAMKKMAG